jgi:hypothetical protein
MTLFAMICIVQDQHPTFSIPGFVRFVPQLGKDVAFAETLTSIAGSKQRVLVEFTSKGPGIRKLELSQSDGLIGISRTYKPIYEAEACNTYDEYKSEYVCDSTVISTSKLKFSFRLGGYQHSIPRPHFLAKFGLSRVHNLAATLEDTTPGCLAKLYKLGSGDASYKVSKLQLRDYVLDDVRPDVVVLDSKSIGTFLIKREEDANQPKKRSLISGGFYRINVETGTVQELLRISNQVDPHEDAPIRGLVFLFSSKPQLLVANQTKIYSVRTNFSKSDRGSGPMASAASHLRAQGNQK